MKKIDLLFCGIFFAFGLFYLALTPPYQVPDEPAHFVRVWQLSAGTLFADNLRQTPKLPDYLSADMDAVSHIPHHPEIRWSLAELKRLLRQSPALSRPAAGAERFYYSYVSGYSPAAYLAQLPALVLCRIFSAKAIFALYLMRLFNLAASALLCAAAFSLMRRISARHGLICAIAALLPMNVFQSMGVSADGMTNALSFLTIALGLSLLGQKEPWQNRNYKFFLAAGALLALCKYVYFLVPLFLYIALLAEARPPARTLLRETGIFIALVIFPAALWALLAGKLLAVGNGCSPALQMQFAVEHSIKALAALLGTLKNNWGDYWHRIVGDFGWLDAPCSSAFAKLYAAAVVSLALFSGGTPREPLRRLFVYLLCPAAVYLVVAFGCYLSWTAPGAGAVVGIQGRYFIAVVPLALLAVPGFIRVQPKTYRRLCALFAACWLCLNFHCLAVIAERYWL